MEKLFSAKVVTPNSKGVLPMSIGGAGFGITFLGLLYEPLQKYAVYIFFAALAGTIIAVYVVKGDIEGYDLKKEMIVFDNHFQIGTIIFPFNEVANFNFKFHAFQGMKSGSYEPDPDIDFKRNIEFGTDNTISFYYKKQSFHYRFHVQSQQHFYLFVQMLEQLYINHINFLENNWYGKTFLMQNVTDDRYQKLKQAYA